MNRSLSRVLAGVAGLAFAVPALATETRINSLSAGTPGGIFNEKSVTIRDSANIYPLPQYMVTYKNSVDVDTTVGKAYGTMNVRYALSDESVLLLFGKSSPWRPVVGVKSIGGLDVAQASDFKAVNNKTVEDPTRHQIGVGFGMKAGESARFGATLAIGGHRNDGGTVAPIDLKSNTYMELAGGLGFDINETNTLDFGLNLGLGFFTDQEAKSEAGQTPAFQDRYIADGANLDFSLIGKGEFQVHQIAKIVPFLRFGINARGVRHNPRTDEIIVNVGPNGNEAKVGHLTAIGLTLGSDLAITPVEGVLIQPGLGLTFRSTSLAGNTVPSTKDAPQTERSFEISRQMLPWYGFAAEAKAFEWCVLRLGARQTIVKSDFDNTQAAAPAGQAQLTNEKHTSTTVNEVTTGVGIKLMGWDLDVNMNPLFFNNGLYAATGNITGGWGVDFALGYDW